MLIINLLLRPQSDLQSQILGSNFYVCQNEEGMYSAQLLLALSLPPQTRYTTSQNWLVTTVLGIKLVYKLRVLLTGSLWISNRRLVTGPTSRERILQQPAPKWLCTPHTSPHADFKSPSTACARMCQICTPTPPKRITTLWSHRSPTSSLSMLAQPKPFRRLLDSKVSIITRGRK